MEHEIREKTAMLYCCFFYENTHDGHPGQAMDS